MLSILIPTYNASCVSLIETVNKQAVGLGISYEILLADDASDEEFRLVNQSICKFDNCNYLQLTHNLGPAKIRNYLADKAKYPYLLFLDSDVLPVNDSFLAEYVQHALPNAAVCGGFIYKTDNIPSNSILRFKYGVAVEQQTADTRSKYPYNSFISMSFLISKDAFMKVRFDESFHLGYEDTLFGKRLEQAGIYICHIENPVYHCVEETSEKFLLKIKRAVGNLIGHEEEMKSYVKLLKWHDKVCRLGMQPICSFIFNVTEPYLISNLISKTPSLKLFAFYKLGYLCSLKQGIKKTLAFK